MQQIADHVGVSKFAVSKALSGKSGISNATREQIYRAATQLGYFIEKGQRFQIKKDRQPLESSELNGVIAILFPNIRFQTKESLYWGPIVEGIITELKNNGLDMIVVTEFAGDNVFSIINPDRLLGIIGVGMVSTALLLEINRLNLPIMLIDHEDPLIRCDTLFMNNYDCVRQLTNKLAGLGHQSMQFVGNINYSRSFYDRWLGFRSILEENRLPYNQAPELLELSESYYTDTARKCFEKLIKHQSMPTALVCANDDIAVEILTVLDRLGISVPKECSVTGFDNIIKAIQSSPKLSTVNVAKDILGKRAVEMLLWRLRNREALIEKVLLSGDTIIRESISVPPVSVSIQP